ncbi:MAG: tetratricopeptide repeat protein, partial [Nannocystaceae bacterium]
LRQAIGDSAPETIAVRVNLGVVQSLQRQPEAVSVLRHALEQQLSVVGEFHPRTPSILRNLGNALARNGDFEGAAEVMRRAVRLREQLHGDDTPALASDLLGLAKVLREQGQIDEAKQVLARVAQRAQLKPSHQKSLQREQAALVQAVASPDAGE